MFYDLNVTRPTSPSAIPTLLECFKKYKYHCIAFTAEVSDADFLSEGGGKKNKNGKNSQAKKIPSPLDVTELSKAFKIKILNRINISVGNHDAFHIINNSPLVKAYDIISFQPVNETVLKTLGGMTTFDILSCNPTIEDSDYLFNRKLYKKFINNGVFFELAYCATVIDSSQRRYLIQRAHIYQCMGKGENVIVSSSTNHTAWLRTPYDVINLCYILGLSEEEAKAAITRTCEKLLLSARTRRRGKCAIEMTLLPSDSVVDKDEISESNKRNFNNSASLNSGRLESGAGKNLCKRLRKESHPLVSPQDPMGSTRESEKNAPDFISIN